MCNFFCYYKFTVLCALFGYQFTVLCALLFTVLYFYVLFLGNNSLHTQICHVFSTYIPIHSYLHTVSYASVIPVFFPLPEFQFPNMPCTCRALYIHLHIEATNWYGVKHVFQYTSIKCYTPVRHEHLDRPVGIVMEDTHVSEWELFFFFLYRANGN